jgi:hypothetical protein
MIASEIRGTIVAVQKLTLTAVVQIGNSLLEAKELVPHGEWETWLEERVEFSQATASRYMKIAREYPAHPNLAALQDLSFTNALKLLALPDDERAEVIESVDVEEATSRELEDEIETLRTRISELEPLEAIAGEAEKWQKKAAGFQAERDRAKDALRTVKESAEKQAKEKMEAELEKTKKELKEKEAAASAEETKSLHAAVGIAEQRLASAEKDLKLARNQAKLELSLLLRNIQFKVNDAKDLILTLEDEADRTQARNALRAILEAQVEKISEL